MIAALLFACSATDPHENDDGRSRGGSNGAASGASNKGGRAGASSDAGGAGTRASGGSSSDVGGTASVFSTVTGGTGLAALWNDYKTTLPSTTCGPDMWKNY